MRTRLAVAGGLRCYIARGRSAESLLTVSFALKQGLILQLSTGESKLTCHAANSRGTRSDPLAGLVRTLRVFASGLSDASCRWPSDAGGCFLDLSRIDDRRCGIAVHGFADPGAHSGDCWVPARGAVLFAAQIPLTNLVSAFIEALEELRASAGFAEEWPWPFPQVELSRLAATQSLR